MNMVIEKCTLNRLIITSLGLLELTPFLDQEFINQENLWHHLLQINLEFYIQLIILCAILFQFSLF